MHSHAHAHTAHSVTRTAHAHAHACKRAHMHAHAHAHTAHMHPHVTRTHTCTHTCTLTHTHTQHTRACTSARARTHGVQTIHFLSATPQAIGVTCLSFTNVFVCACVREQLCMQAYMSDSPLPAPATGARKAQQELLRKSLSMQHF